MNSLPPETARHALVEQALSTALALTPDEAALLATRVTVVRIAAGSAIAGDPSPELRVMVLGRAAESGRDVHDAPDARHPPRVFGPGEVLPGLMGGATPLRLRALREIVIARIPLPALEVLGATRILAVLAHVGGAARSASVASAPGASVRPLAGNSARHIPLVVGISGPDGALARESAHALRKALAPHGTATVADLRGARGALPSRLSLAELLPHGDFQIVVFDPPLATHETPEVDRWLFVVPGGDPGGGAPMTRKRSSGFMSIVPPAIAHHAPSPSLAPRFATMRGEPGLAPRTLLIVHPRGQRIPRRSDRHLAYHRPDEHRHVREGHTADWERLARELAGKAVGFALGAGGARGLAHLGVLRAAAEHSVPVDYIAGTSIGAVMGALVGLGLDVPARFAEAERLAAARPFAEFTLPTTALLRGKRFETLAEELFGSLDIADLWIPLVTMTCELSDFRETVHRRGSLREVLLAGCVLPGVLPPRVLDGKLHIDGGTSDMLPVKLLRAHMGGEIVAVDVSTWEQVDVPDGGYPVGADALLARWRGKPAPLNAFEVFWRAVSYKVARRARDEGATADVLITPAVRSVGVSQLEELSDVERAGYTAASEAFARRAQGVTPQDFLLVSPGQ